MYAAVPSPQTGLMVAQPLAPVHNRSRGVLVIIGCVLCLIFAFSALFSNLYIGTQFISGENGDTYTTIKIDVDIGLYTSCITVDSVKKCTDTTKDMSCDSLKNQFSLMQGVFPVAVAGLCIDLIFGLLDLAGVMRKHYVHSIILSSTVIASMIGFVVCIQTYNNTYCGSSMSDPFNGMSSWLGPAPFLLAVAGVGSLIGVILTLCMKDQPPVVPVMAQQPMVYVQQPMVQQQQQVVVPAATGVVMVQQPPQQQFVAAAPMYQAMPAQPPVKEEPPMVTPAQSDV